MSSHLILHKFNETRSKSLFRCLHVIMHYLIQHYGTPLLISDCVSSLLRIRMEIAKPRNEYKCAKRDAGWRPSSPITLASPSPSFPFSFRDSQRVSAFARGLMRFEMRTLALSLEVVEEMNIKAEIAAPKCTALRVASQVRGARLRFVFLPVARAHDSGKSSALPKKALGKQINAL